LLAEPLLELSDKKIHMHLEDTVLVTPQGALNMTAGVPASLEEVYALVPQRALSLNQQGTGEKFASLVRLMVFNTQGV